MILEDINKKKPSIGEKAICDLCNNQIHWGGKYWQHTYVSVRHMARPRKEKEFDHRGIPFS
jgi:hypothetical protein